MAAETIDIKTVQNYARTFAIAFKDMGVFDGSGRATSSSSFVKEDSSQSKLEQFKEFEAQEKALKRSNNALRDYIHVQNNLKKGIGNQNALRIKSNKLEKVLQKDSILLGKSFITAKQKFDEGFISSARVKEFVSNTSFDKLNEDFEDKMEETADIITTETESTLKKFGKSISDFSKGMFSRYFPPAPLLLGAQQAIESFTTSIKFGSDMNDLFTQSVRATMMGLSGPQWNELEAQNRRLTNQFGSAADLQKQIITANEKYFTSIGDLSETTQFSAQMMKTLSIAGVGLDDKLLKSGGTLDKFGKSFDDIRALSGETFPELGAKLNEYSQSEIGRTKLVAAGTKEERLAVLQRRLSTKQMLLNFGTTSDQAKQLADQFDSINGMNPKERYAESFKIQRAAALLGVKNADLIGKAVRNGGISKLSKEEQTTIIPELKKLAKERSEAMTGNFLDGNNAMVASLLGTSSTLDNLAKSAEVLGTVNTDEAKKAKKTAEDIKKRNVKNTKDSLIGGVATGLKFGELIKTGLTTNSYLLIIIGILTAMGAKGLLSKKGIKGLFKDIGKGLGEATTGAGKLASNAKTNIGRAGRKTIDVLKKGAPTITKAAGNAKTNIGKAGNKTVEAISKVNGISSINISKVAGKAGKLMMGAGKILGKLAFPVTAILTAVEGITAWNKAADTFNVAANKTTIGMKSAAALGGIVEGISFGFLDGDKLSNNIYNNINAVVDWFGDPEEIKAKVKSVNKKLDQNIAIKQKAGKKLDNIENQRINSSLGDISQKNMKRNGQLNSTRKKAQFNTKPTKDLISKLANDTTSASDITKMREKEQISQDMLSEMQKQNSLLMTANGILTEKLDMIITGDSKQTKLLLEANNINKSNGLTLANGLEFSDDADVVQ